jgi:hypothetical protein
MLTSLGVLDTRFSDDMASSQLQTMFECAGQILKIVAFYGIAYIMQQMQYSHG